MPAKLNKFNRRGFVAILAAAILWPFGWTCPAQPVIPARQPIEPEEPEEPSAPPSRNFEWSQSEEPAAKGTKLDAGWRSVENGLTLIFFTFFNVLRRST